MLVKLSTDVVDTAGPDVFASVLRTAENIRIWRKVVLNFALSETYATKLTEEFKQDATDTTRKKTENVL